MTPLGDSVHGGGGDRLVELRCGWALQHGHGVGAAAGLVTLAVPLTLTMSLTLALALALALAVAGLELGGPACRRERGSTAGNKCVRSNKCGEGCVGGISAVAYCATRAAAHARTGAPLHPPLPSPRLRYPAHTPSLLTKQCRPLSLSMLPLPHHTKHFSPWLSWPSACHTLPFARLS